MLVELHIENLGVIERASLEFGPGLGALTGETGAGKTMLVEALELLVGGRADASIVRAGADEARVDGRFVDEREGDQHEIVLSRVVPADGRSRAYIDGRPATATTLAIEASTLIDLHGQHTHQSLMSVAAQRAALDEFGRVDLGPLRAARARVAEIGSELAMLGGDERARAREIDLLRYQVDELNAAEVADAGEDEALAAEEALLSDAQGHRDAGAEAVELLRADDGVDDRIRSVLRAIEGRAPYEEIEVRLAAVAAELDDLALGLRDVADSIEDDPERLTAIRERRQLLVDLRRKYGNTLADVIEFHSDIERRLRELLEHDRRAAELDVQLTEAHRVVADAARAVGDARRAAAPGLAAAVETRLRALALPNAVVSVEVGGPDPSAASGERDDGHRRASDERVAELAGDRVQFLFSANPGSPVLPLQRVASGGELARTMLALRLVITTDSTYSVVPTLVFDEVDAGIGGAAANAVGDALADLGATHQVLVVTHLAQVGARANTHHVVSKEVRGDQTFTTVARVDGDGRVDEIARMLAGDDSDEARQHAAVLLRSDHV